MLSSKSATSRSRAVGPSGAIAEASIVCSTPPKPCTYCDTSRLPLSSARSSATVSSRLAVMVCVSWLIRRSTRSAALRPRGGDSVNRV
jgi:hypothetical protein